MNLLVVGKTAGVKALADSFDAEELHVTNCSELEEAIVRQRLERGAYHCLVLCEMTVLKKKAELLSLFLSMPEKLPVVVLESGGKPKACILLVTEVEKAGDRFNFLLRRLSRFSSLSASRCIDTGESMIVEYQAPCSA